MELKSIGKVIQTERGFGIELEKDYIEGLQSIEGFLNLNIFWWAENGKQVIKEVINKPYVNGPDQIGVFATRSQIRPNPICLTVIEVADIDLTNGIIYTYYIDANIGTNIIDIKPYLPSTDRIEYYRVPKWCEHWPKCVEDSSSFNWEKEFNF